MQEESSFCYNLNKKCFIVTKLLSDETFLLFLWRPAL